MKAFLVLALVAVVWVVRFAWFASSGWAISRLLHGKLECRGTSVRPGLFSFSFILHGVKLHEGLLKQVAGNGLDGYLPCELEQMEVQKLELALQIWPLLRWLWRVLSWREVLRWLRQGHWWKGTWTSGVDGLEALQSHPAPSKAAPAGGGDPEAIDWAALSAACPIRLRLGGATLAHRASMLDRVRWKDEGPCKPKEGEELEHPELAQALGALAEQGRRAEFSQAEWKALGVEKALGGERVRGEHYVKSSGGSYFVPAGVDPRLGEWWGGQECLDRDCAYFYKAKYLRELHELLTAHDQLRDDGKVCRW